MREGGCTEQHSQVEQPEVQAEPQEVQVQSGDILKIGGFGGR